MSGALIVLLVAGVVLLGGGLIAATLRRQDTDRATGRLSRETRSRDRKAERAHVQGENDPRVAGKEAERLAVQKWREPSTAVVKVGGKDITPYVAPDDYELGVARRQFLNRSIVGTFAFSLSAFGATVIAFLWPVGSGGFGSKIRIGTVDEVKASVRENNNFLYFPEGKMWITEYPASGLEKAHNTYSPAELAGMEVGLVALFQKCPHLGCRVPECGTSQWFECGCHGSKYNRVGEKRGGPAPRGMDRFAMIVDSGSNFIVDTGTIIQGPPIGINTTGQEQEGPSCLGASTH